MELIKKAAEYIRCSTEQQEDSPEQQQRETRTYAAAHGYEIISSYIDFGKSGTTFTQRPEFMRMLSEVESGKAQFAAVICYDESRWGRAIDSEENTYWRVHFRRLGVKVLLVKTSIDPDHEYAPMLNAFAGIQASQYSKDLSGLTIRGAFNNGIYSNGGTAPYGYLRIAVNTKTGVERELAHGEWSVAGQEKVKWRIGATDEVETVRFIFSERAHGKSYIHIAKDLNDRSISCPKRGRWRNRDQRWATVSVKTIINNPTYYGARVYNRNSMSKIRARLAGRDAKTGVNYPHWLNDKKDWVIVENAHEALISKELWDKANSWSRLTVQKSSVNQYTFRSHYLLTGLIRCPLCGFNYQGWSGSADGKRYYKYIDGGWQNKRVCSYHGVQKEELEESTMAAIAKRMNNPLVIETIEEELKNFYDQGPNRIKSEIEDITTKLLEVESRLKKWIESFEGSGSARPSNVIIERLRELEIQRTHLKERLLALRRENARIDIGSTTQKVRNYMMSFIDRMQRAPVEEKKLLIRRAVSAIIVDRHEKVAHLYLWKIPAVTEELIDLYRNKKAPTEKPVSAERSGGRT
ncbi:MAG TPA: recombinase family protein [Bacteroidota bacterium]